LKESLEKHLAEQFIYCTENNRGLKIILHLQYFGAKHRISLPNSLTTIGLGAYISLMVPYSPQFLISPLIQNK